MELPSGDTLRAWLARPEDVIIGKLMAWDEGRSPRHESDIRDMLAAVRLGTDAELTGMFDRAYIDEWTARVGGDVAALWEGLKAVAERPAPNDRWHPPAPR